VSLSLRGMILLLFDAIEIAAYVSRTTYSSGYTYRGQHLLSMRSLVRSSILDLMCLEERIW